MTKRIFIVAGFIFPALSNPGVLCAQEHNTPAIQKNFSISVTAGVFQEDFRWSIAGDVQGGSPNILSELIWKNLNGPYADMTATWTPWKGLSLQTSIAASFITSGKVSDTDYLNDNRKNSTFRGVFDSNKGTVNAYEALAGYRIFETNKINVTAYLGYGAARASLFLIGGPLRSSYKTTWKGPIAQAEFQVKIGKHVSTEPVLAYHQLRYHAKANWNLVESFQHPVSFEHSAKGYQLSVGNRIRYHFNSRFSIAAGGDYLTGKTGNGIDKLYLSNNTIAYTQFNEAIRKRFSAGIQATMRF